MSVDLPTVAVWAKQPDGQFAKVAEHGAYLSAKVEPRHLDPGTWELTVPYDVQALAFTRDRLVTFDWRDRRLLTGAVTTFNPNTDESGRTVLALSGLSMLSMLGWALAWPDPTMLLASQPYYDPAAPPPIRDAAETVVLGLIRTNMVDRRSQPITVPTGAGRGTTVPARPAFDNLLELVLRKARRGGIGVSIDLVDTTSSTRAALTATVYVPVDRSARIRFSQRIDGSIRTWSQTEQAPTATRAIVGGAGSGASRRLRSVTTTESDAAALAWSGHREVFVDGPQSFDDAELDAAGTEALDAGTPSVSLSVEAAEAAGQRAFTHYNVGDLAAATLATGLDVVDVISSISVSVDDTGVTVTPTFGDPDAADPAVSTAQLLRALRRDVRALAARR